MYYRLSGLGASRGSSWFHLPILQQEYKVIDTCMALWSLCGSGDQNSGHQSDLWCKCFYPLSLLSDLKFVSILFFKVLFRKGPGDYLNSCMEQSVAFIMEFSLTRYKIFIITFSLLIFSPYHHPFSSGVSIKKKNKKSSITKKKKFFHFF